MTPLEAANHYLYLVATDPRGPLASGAGFAREYEDKASEDDFTAYLNFLDLMYGANAEGEGA